MPNTHKIIIIIGNCNSSSRISKTKEVLRLQKLLSVNMYTNRSKRLWRQNT